MTTANRTEISKKIAENNTEIMKMLKEIEDKLIDPRDPKNTWANVGDTGRLKSDLKDILEYLR